jgi:hypothetical protein
MPELIMGSMQKADREPRVLLLPFRGGPAPGDVSLVERKRRMVWANMGRNKLIAELAVGMARNARRTLRGLGVDDADVNLIDRVRQRVVVLAETVEQARRLMIFLPGWEVLDAVPVEGEYAGWGKEPDQDADPPPGRIATLVYAARYGLGCEILVRATAGSGKLGWDSFRGGCNKKGTTPDLVIDIADHVGDREDTDAEVRRREYREQGLKEVKVTTKQKTQNQNT